MQSTDDKQYPLARAKRPARPGRAVSKKDFRLPKPYRRQPYSEEPERLTRLQVSLLGFAGVMVATLVGVLVLMAHESERSTEGKQIVAAAGLDGAEVPAARLASFPSAPVKAESAPGPPAMRAKPHVKVKPPAGARKKPALRTSAAAAPGRADKPKPQPKPARERPTLATLAPPAPPAPPAPDPDVALITAILLLTPAPAPAPAPAISMELAGRVRAVCLPAVPKESGCLEPHKTKP